MGSLADPADGGVGAGGAEDAEHGNSHGGGALGGRDVVVRRGKAVTRSSTVGRGWNGARASGGGDSIVFAVRKRGE